jgi:hypothetical protein
MIAALNVETRKLRSRRVEADTSVHIVRLPKFFIDSPDMTSGKLHNRQSTPEPRAETMLNEIDTYFQAERAESLLFVAFGLLAIAASAFLLWRYGDAMSRGLAIPLVAVGLIQLAVGGGVYMRTPSQVSALAVQAQSDPKRFKSDETTRMTTVMANFKSYKIIEVAFILIGLVVTLTVSHPFWLGIGMAMLIQGALMLPADITAEQRGAAYNAAIAKL